MANKTREAPKVKEGEVPEGQHVAIYYAYGNGAKKYWSMASHIFVEGSTQTLCGTFCNERITDSRIDPEGPSCPRCKSLIEAGGGVRKQKYTVRGELVVCHMIGGDDEATCKLWAWFYPDGTRVPEIRAAFTSTGARIEYKISANKGDI